ncbi:hypothetical protein OsJ_36315 [Oryza sativa Japonica Group]|uniref:Uncharacterized protein n=1 Tax=Oryza sativa subsp. japonica TaxID=39947 RepID=B9GDG2_ORYSJ|nr:hypothetical protein OsJ_36315 [Oryza sativa Japonica Group]
MGSTASSPWGLLAQVTEAAATAAPSSRRSPPPPPSFARDSQPPPVVGLLARVVADASSCRGSCCHRNLFVPRVPPLLPLLPDQSFGNGGLGLWEEESER